MAYQRDIGKKILNIWITEELHRRLKVKAAEEGVTMKNISLKALEKYLEEDEDELTEEDLRDIEEGRKAVREGNVTPIEVLMEKYGL